MASDIGGLGGRSPGWVRICEQVPIGDIEEMDGLVHRGYQFNSIWRELGLYKNTI